MILSKKEAKIVFYSENDVIAHTTRHGDVFDKKNGASMPLGWRRNDFYQKRKLVLHHRLPF